MVRTNGVANVVLIEQALPGILPGADERDQEAAARSRPIARRASSSAPTRLRSRAGPMAPRIGRHHARISIALSVAAAPDRVGSFGSAPPRFSAPSPIAVGRDAPIDLRFVHGVGPKIIVLARLRLSPP
jgi:hypothetical protein